MRVLIIEMEEFELPVEYNGREFVLPGRFVRRGYSYGIYIEVDGVEVMFEPDEERNLRAVGVGDEVDVGLIKSIGKALERELR